MEPEHFGKVPTKLGAALICIVVGISGCSPSLEGAPRRAFAISEEIGALRDTYGPQQMADFHSANPERRAAIRNATVLGRMYAIDLTYSEFERQLTSESQLAPFAATLTSLALSGSASIVADAATKSLLAAVDTGLKGAGEAYEKKILIGKTIETLQQTMRSGRNRIRAGIVANLAMPDAQYPLELALGDVEQYYNAGTITGGLIGVTEMASLQLDESSRIRASSATIGQYGPDEATAILRDYWRRGGADATRKIHAWLLAESLPVTIAEFLNVAYYAGKRAELVRFLGLARQ